MATSYRPQIINCNMKLKIYCQSSYIFSTSPFLFMYSFLVYKVRKYSEKYEVPADCDVGRGKGEGVKNRFELSCNALHHVGRIGGKNFQTAPLNHTPVSKTFPQTSLLITRWCPESFCLEMLHVRFSVYLKKHSYKNLVMWQTSSFSFFLFLSTFHSVYSGVILFF